MAPPRSPERTPGANALGPSAAPDIVLRVLLLADTHLGFDLPLTPRGERSPRAPTRRGHEFFANFKAALAPARRGEVDAVVHGGDLLYRSHVPAELVRRALAPLLEVAEAGVPVVLTPGNHERSRIPYPLLAVHQRLHVLTRPRTVRLRLRGLRVAFAGFANLRAGIGARFAALVGETGALAEPADLRLLVCHQSFEGATVGPADFIFRAGDADVVRGGDIPAGFAAVLAGHIHRHQVLRHDCAGRALRAPVLYPGSTARTSRAENGEAKGFVTAEFAPDPACGGRLRGFAFHAFAERTGRCHRAWA